MAGMVVWQKLLQPLLPPAQNEYVNLAIAAGLWEFLDKIGDPQTELLLLRICTVMVQVGLFTAHIPNQQYRLVRF